jgi:hypothetical protein
MSHFPLSSTSEELIALYIISKKAPLVFFTDLNTVVRKLSIPFLARRYGEIILAQAEAQLEEGRPLRLLAHMHTTLSR